MKLDDVKILYVCTDFPYPPVHGGLVDMWNRIQALRALGATVDVIVTAAAEPPKSDREKVENLVRHLFISKRQSLRRGVLSLRPGHVAIRTDLRCVDLNDDYDAVLMQTEFTSDILLNKTLKYKISVVRVDNDEYAFHIQTAKAERSWPLKLYYYLEALKIRRHTSRMLPKADMLWFVSHDERARYQGRFRPLKPQGTAFLPAAINLGLLDKPHLHGSQVLFVGNLWSPSNRHALEWYIEQVHPRLMDLPDYKFLIAGSIRGQSHEWLDKMIAPYPNIVSHFDAEDLSLFYKTSAVFVNPMQRGAGVKVKTVEAVLRGLPVVATTVGAEGSGLVDRVHYKCANQSLEFAAFVREFLEDKNIAHEFVRRSQEFIIEQYDQRKVLARLLHEVRDRCRPLNSRACDENAEMRATS
jgi:polysaccharide biosynthesis protein PslH